MKLETVESSVNVFFDFWFDLLGKTYTCKSVYSTIEYKIYITHIKITEDNTKKHKTGYLFSGIATTTTTTTTAATTTTAVNTVDIQVKSEIVDSFYDTVKETDLSDTSSFSYVALQSNFCVKVSTHV
jgi:hypothetical protein